MVRDRLGGGYLGVGSSLEGDKTRKMRMSQLSKELGKSIPDRRNNKSKEFRMGTGLAYLKNQRKKLGGKNCKR